MCFTWDSWNSCTDFLLFFFPHRAPSTDFQGLQCLQVIALHFYYNIPSPAFALRTHKKSAGAAQIVSIKQIPDQKQKQKKKQKEGKKKKNPPFFFLWRIWGRDLITTAGVCRHWNNNNNNNKTHAHTHIHTEKKKEYQATNEYTERMTKHEGE